MKSFRGLILHPPTSIIKYHPKTILLTTSTKRVLMKNSEYPNKFRFLVLIFASLYDNAISVKSANGWYTRVRTLEGWYLCARGKRKLWGEELIKDIYFSSIENKNSILGYESYREQGTIVIFDCKHTVPWKEAPISKKPTDCHCSKLPLWWLKQMHIRDYLNKETELR